MSINRTDTSFSYQEVKVGGYVYSGTASLIGMQSCDEHILKSTTASASAISVSQSTSTLFEAYRDYVQEAQDKGEEVKTYDQWYEENDVLNKGEVTAVAGEDNQVTYTVTFANGKNYSFTVTNGADGKGIASARIDNDHLILTLTDGTTLDLGVVKGDKGDKGEDAKTHEHTYGDQTTVAATCDTWGCVTSTCTTCGDIKYEWMKPTGHNWVDGEIIQKATTSAEGLQYNYCSVCGIMKRVVIDKIVVKEAAGNKGKILGYFSDSTYTTNSNGGSIWIDQYLTIYSSGHTVRNINTPSSFNDNLYGLIIDDGQSLTITAKTDITVSVYVRASASTGTYYDTTSKKGVISCRYNNGQEISGVTSNDGNWTIYTASLTENSSFSLTCTGSAMALYQILVD